MLQFLVSETFNQLSHGICFFVNVSFLLLALYALVRTTILKHLHLQQQVCPQHLGRFSRFLLHLERHRHNPVKLVPKTHALDLSCLSKEEKNFLYVALCDTLHYYMIANQRGLPHGDDVPPWERTPVPSDGQKGIQVENRATKLYLGSLTAAVRIAFRRYSKTRGHQERALEHQISKGMTGLWGSIFGHFHTSQHWNVECQGTKVLGSIGIANQSRYGEGSMVFGDGHGLNPTVEELQVALMLCWREIETGKERYFCLTRSEALLKDAEPPRAKNPEWLSETGITDFFQELVRRDGRGPTAMGHYRSERPHGEQGWDLVADLGFEQVEKKPAGDPLRSDLTTTDVADVHEAMLNEVMDLREEAATLRRRIAVARRDRVREDVDPALLSWEELEGAELAHLPVRTTPGAPNSELIAQTSVAPQALGRPEISL
jgi:hypothetical protein